MDLWMKRFEGDPCESVRVAPEIYMDDQLC